MFVFVLCRCTLSLLVRISSVYSFKRCLYTDNLHSYILMLRVERKLQAFEQKHSLLHRWVPSSSEYQVVKSTMESRRKSKLCAKIQHLARERWFLLSMKAKYAGKLQFDLSLNAWYSGYTATALQMVMLWHLGCQRGSQRCLNN